MADASDTGTPPAPNTPLILSIPGPPPEQRLPVTIGSQDELADLVSIFSDLLVASMAAHHINDPAIQHPEFPIYDGHAGKEPSSRTPGALGEAEDSVDVPATASTITSPSCRESSKNAIKRCFVCATRALGTKSPAQGISGSIATSDSSRRPRRRSALQACT